jgi:hypothetical protein
MGPRAVEITKSPPLPQGRPTDHSHCRVWAALFSPFSPPCENHSIKYTSSALHRLRRCPACPLEGLQAQTQTTLKPCQQLRLPCPLPSRRGLAGTRVGCAAEDAGQEASCRANVAGGYEAGGGGLSVSRPAPLGIGSEQRAARPHEETGGDFL